MPVTDTHLDLEAIRVELARRELLGFTERTYPEYRQNWHHAVLADALDRFVRKDIRRLMIFCPPQHGKSELVSRRLPAYLLGHYPDDSIIACSYGADLASRMNRDVQRIIDEPSYSTLFPGTQLFGRNVRSEATGTWMRNSDLFEVVSHRGGYRSAGVGGGITGMGCQWGLIDDPIKNVKEAHSITYRDSVWEWYGTTFYTRLRKDAGVLLTMTRWHEDDLAGRLLKMAAEDPTADQWTVVSLPAIAEAERAAYDPRQEGEPLWPDFKGQEDLGKIKAALGSYLWNALYQQRPAPEGGGLIKIGWFKFYTVQPAQFQQVIQSWDMTFKGKKDSAYVVGQVWGRNGGDKYLLDQIRAKMDFPATVLAVKALTKKWPQATAKYIEDAANGPAIIDTLKHDIQGLIARKPDGGKEERAAAVSPSIEAGNVYLPDLSIAPWIGDLLSEVAAFPKGTYKDQVDTLTQALIVLQQVPTSFGMPIGIGNASGSWFVRV